MTLRHLTVFLCVCDEKNMTAAAEKLHIAQPSVSQTIAELEKYYNVKLFERLGRKLFITAAGQQLLTYARHIVSLNKEAEDVMRTLNYSVTVRVGASVTVGTCMLAQLLKKFTKGHPEVKVMSVVNNTKIIESMLLEDQLDIGLVEGKVHSPVLLSQPFAEDELVLVTSAVHSLASKVRLEAAALENMELIIREEGSGTRELFESVMASQGIHWRIAGVYNNAESIKSTVAAGLAVSVMSKRAVEKEAARQELAIIEIEDVKFIRQFNLIYHKNKYLSPVLQEFIQLCMG